jgi:hypothetical protein
MIWPSRWFATTPVLLLPFLLIASGARGQSSAMAEAPCQPCFEVRAETQLFGEGQPVTLEISLYNGSAEPLFVGNLKGNGFVNFKITGPDGKEVLWRGEAPIASRKYSFSDFTVLPSYKEISEKRTISLEDGAGFVFDKVGEYSVTAEYSAGPLEEVARFAGETKVPADPFDSKTKFCIEGCIVEPLPVHDNTSQAPLSAVNAFYTYITQYKPLGIPSGPAMTALRPLLSKRLAGELDSFQACDDDYYRRYGEVLEENHYKPGTPWLEDGLFSGADESADVTKFYILDSKVIGKNRVDVHLKFTVGCVNCDETDGDESDRVEGYDCEGVVTVILEEDQWVVDDFVPLDGNNELSRLSDGFSVCKDGRWVGDPVD